MLFACAPELALLALISVQEPAEVAPREGPVLEGESSEGERSEGESSEGEPSAGEGEPSEGEGGSSGGEADPEREQVPPPASASKSAGERRRELGDAITQIVGGSVLASLGVGFLVTGILIGVAHAKSGPDQGLGWPAIGVIALGSAGTVGGAAMLAMGGGELHEIRRASSRSARLRLTPGAWLGRTGGGLTLGVRF